MQVVDDGEFRELRSAPEFSVPKKNRAMPGGLLAGQRDSDSRPRWFDSSLGSTVVRLD